MPMPKKHNEARIFDRAWEGQPLLVVFTDEDGEPRPLGFFSGPADAAKAAQRVLSEYIGRSDSSDDGAPFEKLGITSADVTPYLDTGGFDFSSYWEVETLDGDVATISLRGTDGFGLGWKRNGRYLAWFTDEYQNRFDQGFYRTLDDVAEMANNYTHGESDEEGNAVPSISGSDLNHFRIGKAGFPISVFDYNEACGCQSVVVFDMGEEQSND